MKFCCKVLFLLFLVAGAIACSNKANDVRYIEYHFEDASGDPAFQRDYAINIAPTEASAEITNGDSMLATGHFPLLPGQFDSIRYASRSVFGLKHSYQRANCEDCNTQSLVFMDSARNTLKMIVWNGGRAPADLLLFKEQMMDKINNFNVLLQSTYPRNRTQEE